MKVICSTPTSDGKEPSLLCIERIFWGQMIAGGPLDAPDWIPAAGLVYVPANAYEDGRPEHLVTRCNIRRGVL